MNVLNRKTFQSFVVFIVISLSLLALLNQLFFLNQSYFGNEYILIYFSFSIIVLYFTIYLLELQHIKKKIFLTFIFYKIPISLFMLYLIINRWNWGDLPGYYFQVIDSLQNGTPNNFSFSNVGVIQYFNYYLFNIFPNSLWGMMFFYSLLSMVAYLIIYKVFYQTSYNRNLLFFSLFLLPVITLQSSFFGKDGYMLFFISLFFLVLQNFFENKYSFLKLFSLFILLFLIFSIRAYQAAIIILALYFTFISKNKILFIVGTLIILISTVISYKFIITNFLGNIDLQKIQVTQLLNHVYSGGTLMLEPYPIPLNILQIFRPFPWEANNGFMLFVSFYNIGILVLILYLLKKNYQLIKYRIKNNKIYTFLFFFSMISIFIYSFNPNMGDMTRRTIYFIPFLMVLLA